MMVSPQGFYEYNLKGKSAEEIMKVIRRLKREIGRLKNFLEKPDFEAKKIRICPGPDVQISCNREYLEEAIEALEKAGGNYVPTAAEKKAMDFDADIPYISKVVFSMGGFFGGYETRTFTIDGDKVRISIDGFPFPKSIIKKESNPELLGSNPWDNIESIQGLKGYSVDEVIDITKKHILSVLMKNGEYVDIIAAKPYGSRAKGTAKPNSDLDIVIQYNGDVREDTLFNMLNDEEDKLYIDGIEVDINPINAEDSGNIDDYLARVYDYDKYNDVMDKIDFLCQFADLHIGEWRKNYDTRRFGYVVMDGTQWELEIYYSNGRRARKYSGDNAYPYNFDSVLDLFGVE